MTLLAIESSTQTCSIALARGNSLLAGVSWENRAVERQHLFTALPKLLQDNEIAISDVAQYVVGSGPGSFSGIRIAIAACQGLAQPSGATVSCLPSTAVAALPIAQHARTVLVVGDARRNRLWCAEYRQDDGRLLTMNEPRLIDIDALGDCVSPETTIVSPDYDRIAEVLTSAATDGAQLVGEKVVPSANDLASLAMQALGHGDPLGPPVPTYMHPAVFVAPRFTPSERDAAS